MHSALLVQNWLVPLTEQEKKLQVTHVARQSKVQTDVLNRFKTTILTNILCFLYILFTNK